MEKLEYVLSYVYGRLVQEFGEKLEEVILYGSYARGDFHEESDVDVALLLRVEREELERYYDVIAEIMSEVSLEFDLLVNIASIPSAEFRKYKEVLPYYRNINSDGVRLSA